MSYATYNLLIDSLGSLYFSHACYEWDGEVWGPDYFGMYCAGHEL